MIVRIAFVPGVSCLTGRTINRGDEVSPVGKGFALASEVAARLVAAGKTQPTIVESLPKLVTVDGEALCNVGPIAL